MNVSSKSLVSIAKVLVVLGLLGYVFATIQWQDALVIHTGSEQTTIPGKIVGHWNHYPVEFVATDNRTFSVSAQQQTLQQVNPGFFTYLNQADPWWLLLGALGIIFVVMFSAFRWHWLANSQNLTLSKFEAIRLTWIGLFFNNFVPGQTGGDLVKAYYIAKNSPQKRLTAILTVIADRVIGLSALIVVSLITVTWYFDRFRDIAILLWLGLIAGLLLVLVLLNRSLRRALGLSRLVKKLPDKLHGIIYNLDTAIRNYHDHKSGVFIWWLLSILNHVVSMIGIYALSRSINMGVPAIEFLALVPVIFIVSAIPIAPNGWGIGEALFGNLFGQYGAHYLPGSTNAEQIMSTRGVALSILFRLLSMCLSLIGAFFLLFSKEKISLHPLDNNPSNTSKHEDRNSQRNQAC